jgi:AbrB family looped-hinge helix DNA binding protein
MICVKNMKNTQAKLGFRDVFYGTATIGERGQIVIPAEAREDMDIKAGEKLLIMKHPAHAGLMVFKIDDAREFLNEFQSTLNKISVED